MPLFFILCQGRETPFVLGRTALRHSIKLGLVRALMPLAVAPSDALNDPKHDAPLRLYRAGCIRLKAEVRQLAADLRAAFILDRLIRLPSRNLCLCVFLTVITRCLLFNPADYLEAP